MAQTYDAYTATGSSNTFSVTFTQYTYTSLLVTVNSIATTDYTYDDTAKTVTIKSPVLVAGDSIIIRRITSLDILYKFAQGAAFTGAHIDADIMQAFGAVEEARDYSGLIGYSLGDDLNARQHKIYNLAPGTNDGDAVNYLQLKNTLSTAQKYTDSSLLRTLRVPNGSQFNSLQPPASLKGRILYFDSSTGQPAPALPGTIEEADFLKLQDYDGEKYIGICPDFATLRTLVPAAAGQTITLREYAASTGYGGGKFEAVNANLTDDGGYVAHVNTSWAWRRILNDVSDLNVVHFGAIPDGSTDCAAAVQRMYTWSQARTDWAKNVGVNFPAGNFAMGTFDSSGTYISYFRLSGPPVTFGYLSKTHIKLIGAADSIAFHVQARYSEIHGITWDGQYNVDSVVRHFFRNEVKGGAYFHGTCFRALNVGGRSIFCYDTIDFKCHEFYSSNTYDSVIYGLMSGQTSGTWDHITAIELSNFNIQGHAATAAGKDALFLPRAGQSLIYNGWIEHSAYPANLSEGTWIIDQLSLEGNSQPVYAQYSKITEKHINVQGGSAGTYGIDYTQGAVGNLNGVTRPSWVTSAYEQGHTRQIPQGTEIHGSMAYDYLNSANRFGNMNSTAAWVHIGGIKFPDTGSSCTLRILGTGGFNSATASPTPGSTAYGGGEAVIRVQHKDSTDRAPVSWHGEGSSPILEVRYTNTYASTINIYVRVRAYTYAVAALVETDSTSRLQTGTHFYWSPDMAAVADIDSVTTQVANPTIAFSNGTYGFGMGMGDGTFALSTPTSVVAGNTAIPINVNGTNLFVTATGSAGRIRVQRFAFTDLPALGSGDAGVIVWCSGTAGTPSSQLIVWNGAAWKYVGDPSTTVTAAS